MKKVFLTGATGFLGSYVARLLVKSGYEVTATYRKTSRFDLVKEVRGQIKWVEGDLENLAIIEQVMREVEVVIHCAAVVSFQSEDKALMYKVNVEATRDLVNLALQNKIKRFVHISSIAALGRHKNDEELDENAEWQDSSLNTDYGISKQLAEREVWRGSAEGLDMVILNPALIIGTGYWAEGSPAMIDNGAKCLPFYPTGSTGFVDVRDVANFCIAAIDLPYSGLRIIISAENKSYKDFFSTIALHIGGKVPSIPLTKPLILIAVITEYLLAKFSRRKRKLSKQSLEAANRNGFYDNSLSQETFKLNYRDIDTSLKEMVDIFTKSRDLTLEYGVLSF